MHGDLDGTSACPVPPCKIFGYQCRSPLIIKITQNAVPYLRAIATPPQTNMKTFVLQPVEQRLCIRRALFLGRIEDPQAHDQHRKSSSKERPQLSWLALAATQYSTGFSNHPSSIWLTKCPCHLFDIRKGTIWLVRQERKGAVAPAEVAGR
jgi:hypothetical protein